MEGRIEKLVQLVDQFGSNIKQYKSPSYDEANTRVDFIDKFFELLDWDVSNDQGFSEDYREVVREDKVVISGKPKAPDYSFRIGGIRKFFVEAKKPSVNIKEDIIPAFQVRRYAYTAKLPLSVLTDFEEFSVYDTRIKPSQKDNAGTARIFYCTYNEYINNLDFIYSTFSKTAILKGSFDRYVDENKNKKGTSEVDKEFLKMIEGWRNDLARNIAIRNKELTVYNLNYAVQKIIDRLIFLRIAEDRQMEDYGALSSSCNESNVYIKLDETFKRSDNKYNSGLFRIEDWISNLQIDNKILTPIIKGLYYPDCPYEFSVLPIEILGHIYEQFLGKTIRLTASHQAKVEEKPEVRKAGGVYYTPQYIVDYIVENTVGEKVKGKKPEDIANLKILDPACGSGSFLVGAYNYLLNYHLEYYTKETIRRKSLKDAKIYQITENTFRLSTEEKHRILLNNIYGVDIDYQAVEVTKLSLLLKLMEGEFVESSGQLFKHSDLKLLPDLSENIKCGNSLIGSDFYDDKTLSLFNEDELRKVNAFDWEEEFLFLTSPLPAAGRPGPEGSSEWGFDVVIGNPPYVFTRDKGFSEEEKNYFYKKYPNQNYQLNTYTMFIEIAISKLLCNEGYFGFIIPNNWLSIISLKNFRDYILSIVGNVKIVNNLYKVFEGANVDTSILLFKNENSRDVTLIESKYKENYENIQTVNYKELLKDEIIQINLYKNIKHKKIISKIDEFSIDLKEIATVSTGLKAYQTGKGKPPQKDIAKKNRIFHSKNKINENYKKYLEGKDVQRFHLGWSGDYLKYGDFLAEPRKSVPFDSSRILIRQIPSKPPYCINAVYTDEVYLNDINSMVIFNNVKGFSLKFILGIINSKLISFWFIKKFDKFQRNIFPQFKVKELSLFPIPTLELENTKEKSQHDKLGSLVDQMLSAQKDLHNTNTESDKKVFQQKVDLLDRQIDNLVYELYGLSDEEIGVVEGG